MSQKILIAIVFVLLALPAGTASALPLHPEAVKGETGFFFELWGRVLQWIEGHTQEERDGTALEMDGCHLDPNGACVSAL